MLGRKMISAHKRPVGVTLLAVVFLWIGVGGSIFFPIITGFNWNELAEMFPTRLSAAEIIPGSYLYTVLLVACFVIVYLVYVAYAVIGFGLWKLKNWARKAVIGISLIGMVAGAIAAPFIRGSWTMSLATLSGSVLPFAWIGWYLYRPRVKFSFALVSGQQDDFLTSEPPAGLTKRGKLLVVFAIFGSIMLFVLSLWFAIQSGIRSSQIFQLAMEKAWHAPCVSAKLGNAADPGWSMMGELKESDTDGEANLSIPLRGVHGKGDLQLEATKSGGVWTITSLVLVKDGEQIRIVPAQSGCK